MPQLKNSSGIVALTEERREKKCFFGGIFLADIYCFFSISSGIMSP